MHLFWLLAVFLVTPPDAFADGTCLDAFEIATPPTAPFSIKDFRAQVEDLADRVFPNQFPQHLLDLFFTPDGQVKKYGVDFNALELAHALQIFGRHFFDHNYSIHKTDWQRIDTLKSIIESNLRDFDTSNIGYILQTLSSIHDVPTTLAEAIGKELITRVQTSPESFTEKNLTQILMSLARLGYKEKNFYHIFSHELVTRIHQIGLRSIFSCAWALVVADYVDPAAFGFILTEIRNRKEEFKQQILEPAGPVVIYQALQIATFLNLFYPEVPAQDPAPLLKTYHAILAQGFGNKTIVSHLQTSVMRTLDRVFGSKNIRMEAQLGGFIQVDFAIESKKIVVEVDGPTHYDRTGLRLRAVDAFRTRILNGLGWKVARIRWDEWQATTTLEQKNALILDAIQRAE